MKLSKKITLGCWFLSIALLFVNSLSQKTFGQAAYKKTELETLEDVKKNYIDKLKADLQNQQKKAVEERNKCNEMIAMTKKASKNPEDVKAAPITFTQCNIASSAEEQVSDTKKKLLATEVELADIQKQKSQLPTDIPKSLPADISKPSDSNGSNWLTWLFFAFIGIISLCLFGDAYLFRKKNSDLYKNILKERDLNNASFGKLGEKIGVTNKVIINLTEAVKLQHGKIEGLQLKLREKDNNFKEMVDELIQTVRLQQGKIEELEFKIKKGDERTK